MSTPAVPGVMRIPARYMRTLLLRGFVVWLLSRLGVKTLYMFIADSAGGNSDMAAAFTNGSPIILTAWTVVLSAVLVRFELYRRHEVALLNNLGVLTSHVVLFGALPAVVIETALVMVR